MPNYPSQPCGRPYGPPPYNQPPYNQPPYGPAPYGHPYGLPPYGPAPYGPAPVPPVPPYMPERRSRNGLGITGFVFSILAVCIGWYPFFGLIFGPTFCFVGLLLSFLGMFRRPRDLAIAGLIMSVIAAAEVIVFTKFVWTMFD